MDKFDKLIETRWFMKVVALILALLLFDSVYDPDKDVSNINVPSEQDSVVLTNIPVKSYYDTDNLIVTGVPETVDVTLTGPKNFLQQAKAHKNFEVYADLSDAQIGTERVPIKVRNLSDKLKATVDPAYVDVKVQEKVTKDFKVDVEFDRTLLEDGYISEPPVVEPQYITITGGKDEIERISYVKAVVNVKGPIKDTVRREAQIQVLDRDMNKLDVMLNYNTVDVTIPVKSLSKTVPIRIIQKGSPPEGVTIKNISLDVNEVKIFGSQEALDRTENVRVEVDVSQINGDTDMTVPVIISDGINEVNPSVVKATISTSVSQSDTVQDEEKEKEKEKEENKTFSNIPIQLTGLSNQFEATVQSPPNGISLTVTGKSGLIEQLKASDFQVFLDLSNLTEGDHDVKINVKGPADVQWKLATEVAKVSITQKEI
ncbi:YbbR-like domain-containing protein [Bacillus sp. FJAT-49705]|uniref:YbbR-like domain-containing protein n=1 Tax=Cytobacillus citreus TaxID=2833586 RepID=A0ABS5NYH2_9BACI|nr:CdaR family protein [Cytobacillus citreus]MBS4192879.1 YbbR-like domain-containing protein [Cytobacillus citreus]